jgi:hypothetical protein
MRPRNSTSTRVSLAAKLPARRLQATALSLLLLATVDATAGAKRPECDRVAAIAEIVTEFVHTCSPGQCATLKAISRDGDAAAPLRTLAAIVLRIDHRPRFDDLELLRTLQRTHPEPVRTLARAVERLVHVPDPMHRAELIELLAERHGRASSCSVVPDAIRVQR